MKLRFAPTKKDVLEFILKYNNPKHCAIVTQVPMTDENMDLIDAMKHVLGIAIHRRWRGPNWYWGYNTKANAERVSVYPRNRNISIDVSKSSWSDSIDAVLSVKQTRWISSKYERPFKEIWR